MTKKEEEFVELVWGHYKSYAREMPWRNPEEDGSFDPYKILVSEFMLQQTQVERVLPKFTAFIARFPTLEGLAEAELSDVIELWVGLGYNRRAKYLHDAAKQLVNVDFPKSVGELISLKGIGENTAAAVLTYSFNTYHPFVETNIRTAYIHNFFPNERSVMDKQILELLDTTATKDNPREFFWALMDYGTHLKKSGVRNNAKSKHYTKQSKFEGSQRQLRGRILKKAQKNRSIENIHEEFKDERLDGVLDSMQSEGLIKLQDGRIHIA